MPDQVNMRVGERRDDRAPTQVDSLGAPTDRRLYLALSANGDDAPGAHGECLGARPRRVEGVDRAIVEHDGTHTSVPVFKRFYGIGACQSCQSGWGAVS